MCLFYYLLHLSSFASTPFLLFLPCIILLCVSCVCTYPLRDEGHGLKGLHCFFILPHGLVHWLDRNSYPFNLLGFCPYCFSFYYAYRPTGCHFYNIGLLGFLSLFLGFHGPFTLLLPISVLVGLLAIIPAILAHWDFYLFSWASMAHLLSSCFFHFLPLSSFFVVRHFILLGPLSKVGINIYPLEHVDCSYNSYANALVVFFRELFKQ